MRGEFPSKPVRLLLFGKVDQNSSLVARILQGALEPHERPFIDDGRVVLLVDIGEALGKKALAMRGELLLRAFRDENVIDIRADLTCIEHLHPKNALGRGFDREVWSDDRGGL